MFTGDSCASLARDGCEKNLGAIPLEDQLLPSLQLNVHKPHPRTQVPLVHLRVPLSSCHSHSYLVFVEVHRRRGHCQLYAQCSPVVFFGFFLNFGVSVDVKSQRLSKLAISHSRHRFDSLKS